MKKSLLLAILFFTCTFVFGQNELLVQSSSKGMFLQHTVKAKENYYSIGRLYHVTPKEIEAFNGLDMNHGLSIGQTLHIPLNASNFPSPPVMAVPYFMWWNPRKDYTG